jgi:hypothetical protein
MSIKENVVGRLRHPEKNVRGYVHVFSQVHFLRACYTQAATMKILTLSGIVAD